MVATTAEPKAKRGRKPGTKTNAANGTTATTSATVATNLPRFVNLTPYAEAVGLSPEQVATEIHQQLGQPAGVNSAGVFETTQAALAIWIDYRSQVAANNAAVTERQRLIGIEGNPVPVAAVAAPSAEAAIAEPANAPETPPEIASQNGRAVDAEVETEPAIDEAAPTEAESSDVAIAEAETEIEAEGEDIQENAVVDDSDREVALQTALDVHFPATRLKDFERSRSHDKTLENFLSAQRTWTEEQRSAALVLIAQEQGKGKLFLKKVLEKYPKNQVTVRESMKRAAATMVQAQSNLAS